MGTKSTKAITLSDKDFSTKVYFPLNNGRAPGLETLAAARHLFLQHPARQHWLSHGSNSLKSVKCGKQVKVVTVPITHIRCLVPAHIPQEKNLSLLLKKQFHQSTIESVSSQLQFPHCSIVSCGTIDVSIMVETDGMRDFVPLLFLCFAKGQVGNGSN